MIRPAATNGLFTNGYTNVVAVRSSGLSDPGAGPYPLLLIEQLDVSGAFLLSPIDFSVAVDYKNDDLAIQGGGPTNSLSSSFAAKTGLLRIAFGNGDGTNTTQGTGVILQTH